MKTAVIPNDNTQQFILAQAVPVLNHYNNFDKHKQKLAIGTQSEVDKVWQMLGPKISGNCD